jgi:hypothetical protein
MLRTCISSNLRLPSLIRYLLSQRSHLDTNLSHSLCIRYGLHVYFVLWNTAHMPISYLLSACCAYIMTSEQKQNHPQGENKMGIRTHFRSENFITRGATPLAVDNPPAPGLS